MSDKGKTAIKFEIIIPIEVNYTECREDGKWENSIELLTDINLSCKKGIIVKGKSGFLAIKAELAGIVKEEFYKCYTVKI